MKILFIVESPGKITKISKILGKKYIVKASVGHFRDLDNKSMSINFENNFEPLYVITKPDVVKNLKLAMKNINMVYIASDLDKEGEAIGQHIFDVLKPSNYKRLIFNAITKEAIFNSIKNAGKINKNLVNTQKARRILDRLYGYLISPILQKQIGGKLSAGRVQSVAAKIVIDKENEIKEFMENNKKSTYFKINGVFSSLKTSLFEIINNDIFDTKKTYDGKSAHISLLNTSNPNSKVITFMKKCLKSKYIIHSISDKISIRHPSPPFETSTLQQEANRKFGMSVDITMKIAQKLYESGYITYMRTDSIEISTEGHNEIKKIIEEQYGKEYYQKTVYKNKSINAQEAHEAIRPTHPNLLSLENDVDDELQIKLYKLIWQRTIASQMKPATINITIIQINISKYIEEKINNPFYYFQSQIEKIIFPGFMKVYIESIDDVEEEDEIIKDFKGKIPKHGDEIIMEEIFAKQEYKKPPPRYSEASLVKILKKLGIGRPSTYVNTIKTIINREYIKIGNVTGIKKDIIIYKIKSENKKYIMQIFEENSTIQLGKELKKIIPTDLGITVNNFLVENFPEMMDYKFTAKIEEELDAISNGKKIWHEVVRKFYNKLIPIVEEWSKKKEMIKVEDKLLGIDDHGNEIYTAKTKYGPVVKKQIGGKIIYAKIPKPLTLEKIKLNDAIKFFEYPKLLGKYNNKEIMLHKGQYGIYLSYDKHNYSIGEDMKSDISLKKAIEIIQSKKNNNIAEFNIIENKKKIKAIVLNGQYGPYIQVLRDKKKINYSISNLDPTKLTDKMILTIINKKNTKKFNKVYSGSKNSKK